MAIVAGFDVHRAQITFDALDTETGEVTRGRIDATPAAVARWAARFAGREIACRGGGVHGLAVRLRRARGGRGGRASGRAGGDERVAGAQAARQDRSRGRALAAELLADGRLPEAWIPPEHVRQWRSRARMRHTLIDERTRVDAAHPGDAVSPRHRRDARTSCARARAARSSQRLDAARRTRASGSRSRSAMVDAIDAQIAPLERELRQLARRQTGCQALMRLYGMGELTSLVTLCELGDVTRLSASRKAVRMAGIDIGARPCRSRRRRSCWRPGRRARARRSRSAAPTAPTAPCPSPAAPGGAGVGARHPGVDPGLVDEDEAAR